MSTKEESFAILDPYIPIITEVIRNAVDEFSKDPKKLIYCNRTKACIINDLIIKNSLENLYSVDGIRFRQCRGNTYIIIRDKFILRFKKLDKNLRTSNAPTNQSNKYIYQESLFSDLPDPVTNIFAGYTWNNSQSSYSGIYLTCPLGRNLEWSHDLSPAPAIAEIIPIINIKNPDPSSPSTRKRVKPKKQKESDKNVKNK